MIRIQTDVFCDNCGNWEHGPVDDRPKRRKARKLMNAKGWVTLMRKGRLVDQCPECQVTLPTPEPDPCAIGHE